MRSVPETMSYYQQGFLSKFAEYGLDGRPYLSFMMKTAQAAPPQTQQPPKSLRSPQDDPWAPAVTTKPPQQPPASQDVQQPRTYTQAEQNAIRMWKGMNNNQRMQWLYDHGVDIDSFSKQKNQDKINTFLNATNARRSAGSLPWTPPQGKMRRTGIFQGGKEVMLDSRGKFRAQNGISGSAQSQGNLSKVWVRNRNQTGL